MTGNVSELGACDLLRFLGKQLDELEENLRRVETAVLAVGGERFSERRTLQAFDLSLQTIQDLSNLCAGGSVDLKEQKMEAQHLSRHLRLGSLKSQLVQSGGSRIDEAGDVDLFDR